MGRSGRGGSGSSALAMLRTTGWRSSRRSGKSSRPRRRFRTERASVLALALQGFSQTRGLDPVPEVDAGAFEPVLGFEVEARHFAAEDQEAHRDQDRAAYGNDRLVVALHHGESGGHLRERHGGEEEGDRQAGAVDREEEGAAADRVGQGGGGEDRSQGRTDAGGPGDREGGAGDDRAAFARPGQEGVDVPLAVEAGDEERGDEEDAHGDDQDPGNLRQQLLVVLEGRAEAGRGQTEEDEDRREAGDEEEAGAEDPAPAGVVELARRDPRHRRQVARHQRQDAGGEEGDDPGREGGEDPDSRGGIGGGDAGKDHDPSGYPQA